MTVTQAKSLSKNPGLGGSGGFRGFGEWGTVMRVRVRGLRGLGVQGFDLELQGGLFVL